MDFKKSITQKCIQNENGICYLDTNPCNGICNMFVSFDRELQHKCKVSPVDRYAFEQTLRR